MNDQNIELERWLAGADLLEDLRSGTDDWLAAFDADRQAVVFKLGPYKKLYLRPEKFIKRFYHQLYSLDIEAWPFYKKINLFGDLCTVEMTLDLHFQATLTYAQRNSERLPSLNQHIRQTYVGLVEDIVARELQCLDEGGWVHSGVSSLEQSIVRSVCELLAIQHIQVQANCKIAVSFQEFASVQPGRDTIYLHALKRTFETNDLKNREMIRQQRLLEQQELEERRSRLQHLQEIAQLELAAQALEADKTRRMLEEKQDQLARQLEIEKRIHAEQLRHEARLKEMALDSELRLQEQHQAKQRLTEIQRLDDELLHLASIRDKKLMLEKAARQVQGQTLGITEGDNDAIQ